MGPKGLLQYYEEVEPEFDEELDGLGLSRRRRRKRRHRKRRRMKYAGALVPATIPVELVRKSFFGKRRKRKAKRRRKRAATELAARTKTASRNWIAILVRMSMGRARHIVRDLRKRRIQVRTVQGPYSITTLKAHPAKTDLSEIYY